MASYYVTIGKWQAHLAHTAQGADAIEVPT